MKISSIEKDKYKKSHIIEYMKVVSLNYFFNEKSEFQNPYVDI